MRMRLCSTLKKEVSDMNIIAQDLRFAYTLCIFAVHEDSQSGRISSRVMNVAASKKLSDCSESSAVSFSANQPVSAVSIQNGFAIRRQFAVCDERNIRTVKKLQFVILMQTNDSLASFYIALCFFFRKKKHISASFRTFPKIRVFPCELLGYK